MNNAPAHVDTGEGAPAPGTGTGVGTGTGTEVIARLRSRTADRTRQCGRDLGRRLAAGDLVILSGELGAGKTTFTQGLAEGLGVRGPITSPTFVIARVHPSLSGGVPLVHVDAYRLGSLAELDDLDLDAAVEDSVTVVEWGEGKAEVLAQAHYTVHLARALADDEAEQDGEPGEGTDDADADAAEADELLDPRLITITRVS